MKHTGRRGAYLVWLATTDESKGALTEHDRRDWAVRDYKRHMKQHKGWSASSVNQALAAIDNFYRSRQMGRPDVAREQLPQVSPRALGDPTNSLKPLHLVQKIR